jgi:hypothetical protein
MALNEAVKLHPTIARLHKEMLDSSLDVYEAYKKACVAIYELNAQVVESQKKVSAGFVRANTSHLKWKSKDDVNPVDDGEWLKTGKV